MKNILIEGTRGKSGIVELLVKAIQNENKSVFGKITGRETIIFFKNEKIKIIRKKGNFFIDVENKKILKKYKNCEYKIFENQALSCYTMRAVHNLFKPDIIVIPNIRYEHQDHLGETIHEQAVNFAVNFKGAKIVITTERKKEVLKIFKFYCSKYNIKLINIKEKEVFPSIQSLYLIEKIMEILFKKKLDDIFFKYIKNLLKLNVSLRYCKYLKLWFFRGSKVNDIESTENAFNYLKKTTKKDFCFVCYFRRDRVERTKAFIPFFNKFCNDKRINKFFICGYNLNSIPKHNKIVKIDINNKNFIYEYCFKNKLVLFTAINSVNEFMKSIENDLLK
jgi:gamma-polyglutamate synthase